MSEHEHDFNYADVCNVCLIRRRDLSTVDLTVKITNVYDDGEVVTVTERLVADAPDSRDPDYLRDYWAEEWLFPLTGTGRTEGDATYFVYVVESSDPELVGMYWEWGL